MVEKLIRQLKKFVEFDGERKARQLLTTHSKKIVKGYDKGWIQPAKESSSIHLNTFENKDVTFDRATLPFESWSIIVTPRLHQRKNIKTGKIVFRDNKLDFHVVLGHEDGLTLTSTHQPSLGSYLVFRNDEANASYGVKFDHKQVKGEKVYDLLRKLHGVAKELGIGVSFKDVDIDKGEIKTHDFIHIYPKFEKNLSEEEVIERYAEFYETAKRHGVDIKLNTSQRTSGLNEKVHDAIRRRGKAEPEFLEELVKSERHWSKPKEKAVVEWEDGGLEWMD